MDQTFIQSSLYFLKKWAQVFFITQDWLKSLKLSLHSMGLKAQTSPLHEVSSKLENIFLNVMDLRAQIFSFHGSNMELMIALVIKGRGPYRHKNGLRVGRKIYHSRGLNRPFTPLGYKAHTRVLFIFILFFKKIRLMQKEKKRKEKERKKVDYYYYYDALP